MMMQSDASLQQNTCFVWTSSTLLHTRIRRLYPQRAHVTITTRWPYTAAVPHGFWIVLNFSGGPLSAHIRCFCSFILRSVQNSEHHNLIHVLLYFESRLIIPKTPLVNHRTSTDLCNKSLWSSHSLWSVSLSLCRKSAIKNDVCKAV